MGQRTVIEWRWWYLPAALVIGFLVGFGRGAGLDLAHWWFDR